MPAHRAPRKKLARVLRQAERWNALVDAIKDEVEKVADLSADEKVATLFELVELYKDACARHDGGQHVQRDPRAAARQRARARRARVRSTST